MTNEEMERMRKNVERTRRILAILADKPKKRKRLVYHTLCVNCGRVNDRPLLRYCRACRLKNPQIYKAGG